MSDRFSVGMIAGAIAGVCMDFIDYIGVTLKWGKLTHWDWMGVAIFGSPPKTIAEEGLAILAHVFFAGILGILFAYLFKKPDEKNLLLKSSVYGIFMWFLLYAITTLYKIEDLMYIKVSGALLDFVSALVFGLVLGQTYRWLKRRVNLS